MPLFNNIGIVVASELISTNNEFIIRYQMPSIRATNLGCQPHFHAHEVDVSYIRLDLGCQSHLQAHEAAIQQYLLGCGP